MQYRFLALLLLTRYYNAWIETYTEEEFKRQSGADIMEDLYEEESSSEPEEENTEVPIRDNKAKVTTSLSSENSGSLSDYSGSFSSEEEEGYPSGDDDLQDGTDSDCSFITFEASSGSGANLLAAAIGGAEKQMEREEKGREEKERKGREEKEKKGREEEKEEEEEGVFADEFSSSSTEQPNFLGALESEVMDLSLPRQRL